MSKHENECSLAMAPDMIFIAGGFKTPTLTESNSQ